jgi:hypothetical protein
LICNHTGPNSYNIKKKWQSCGEMESAQILQQKLNAISEPNSNNTQKHFANDYQHQLSNKIDSIPTSNTAMFPIKNGLQNETSNADSEAINLLADSMNKQSPQIRNALIKEIRPAFKSQKALSKRLNLNVSKIQRACAASNTVLSQTLNLKNEPKHPYHKEVTMQLGVAKGIIEQVVPMNSAHIQKYATTDEDLYKKYKEFLPPNTTPLGEDAFYELVKEMKLKKVDTIQQCKYCFDLTKAEITAERLSKCLLHVQILELQKRAYFLDKEELANGTFGKRIFGQNYTGCMLLIDFTQLDPSTSRHRDFIGHEYTHYDTIKLWSHAYHLIGEPEEREKMSFVVEQLKNRFAVYSKLKYDLVVVYSDGEFKTAMMMDFLVELQREYEIKIVYNFFASNHGGCVYDADGNTANIFLKNYVKNNSESLDNKTDLIVRLVGEIKNHEALKKSESRKSYSDLEVKKMEGIDDKHCFTVTDKYAIGYMDSFNFSDLTIYTYSPVNHPEWCVHPLPNSAAKTDQFSLKQRKMNGEAISHCAQCDFYFIKQHSIKVCESRRKKQLQSNSHSTNINSDESTKLRKSESAEESSDENEDKKDLRCKEIEIVDEDELDFDLSLLLKENEEERQKEEKIVDIESKKRKRSDSGISSDGGNQCSCGFTYEIGNLVYAEFEPRINKKWAVNVFQGKIEDIYIYSFKCLQGAHTVSNLF